jgi:molybdopterin-guanine dinucleotide biosynthesis protein
MIKKVNNYNVIGIVGLAKNTGKTTTLNYILEHIQQKQIGLTSIGLDGESFDQITYLPKPKVLVSQGMMIATAKDVLKQVDFDYELLEETHLNTALGTVCIIRILSKGYVILAGPTTNKDLDILIGKLKKYANQIFIDGAFNRKTFASIDHMDAIIIATGAALSKDMNETIEKTKQVVLSFDLPIEKSHMDKPYHMCIITEKDKKLFKEKNFDEIIPYQKDILVLEIKGALTTKMIEFIVKNRIKNFKLIIEDPTKLMLDIKHYDYLKQLNIRLCVLKQVPIIAVTINPFSPSGYHYDKNRFYQEIKKHIDIEVYNVKEMGS